MTSKRKILVTAEPYGFGPSSKALAIARELTADRATTVVFAGTGTAHAAASRETKLFDGVALMRRYDADSLADSVRGYDLVISVMEPSLALAAAAEQIPCLYVDSLFWMWDWPDNLADADGPHERLVKRLGGESGQQRRDALRMSVDLPMHEAQYVAHRAASRVFYQHYGSETDAAQSLSREACFATSVGAIIDKVPTAMEQRRAGPMLIVSVSGLSNELTDRSIATRWAQAVTDLVADSIRGTAFAACTRIGGNAEILDTVRIKTGSCVEIKPWESHQDFMLDLGQASAFAAPPGITSIAESWSAGVPFFALPGQHYAHASILQRLRGGNPHAFPAIDVNYKAAQDDLAEATAGVLNSVISELRPGSPSRTASIEILRRFLVTLDNDRAKLVASQNDELRRLFGDADGTIHIVREALAFC
jgi:hypothetical protein